MLPSTLAIASLRQTRRFLRQTGTKRNDSRGNSSTRSSEGFEAMNVGRVARETRVPCEDGYFTRRALDAFGRAAGNVASHILSMLRSLSKRVVRESPKGSRGMPFKRILSAMALWLFAAGALAHVNLAVNGVVVDTSSADGTGLADELDTAHVQQLGGRLVDDARVSRDRNVRQSRRIHRRRSSVRHRCDDACVAGSGNVAARACARRARAGGARCIESKARLKDRASVAELATCQLDEEIFEVRGAVQVAHARVRREIGE